jgi:hypothetical protein
MNRSAISHQTDALQGSINSASSAVIFKCLRYSVHLSTIFLAIGATKNMAGKAIGHA